VADGHKSLNTALLAAQRAVEPVKKASENQHHHYKYASAEDVSRTCREALHNAGLMLNVRRFRILRASPFEAGTGILRTEYELAHVDSGETRLDISETPINPERGRPPDKATAAAKTLDRAYYLRGLLQLPHADDFANVDGRDDTAYAPGRRKEQQERPQQRKREEPAAGEPARDPARDRELRKLKALGAQHGKDKCSAIAAAAGISVKTATIPELAALVQRIEQELGKPSATTAEQPAGKSAKGVIDAMAEKMDAKRAQPTWSQFWTYVEAAGIERDDALRDLQETYGKVPNDFTREELSRAIARAKILADRVQSAPA
jgi:hypothetical protein